MLSSNLHPITEMYNNLAKIKHEKLDWCVQCHSRVQKKEDHPHCPNCARKLKLKIAS